MKKYVLAIIILFAISLMSQTVYAACVEDASCDEMCGEAPSYKLDGDTCWYDPSCSEEQCTVYDPCQEITEPGECNNTCGIGTCYQNESISKTTYYAASDCTGVACYEAPDSCTDGILNRDEESQDCGGVYCDKCITPYILGASGETIDISGEAGTASGITFDGTYFWTTAGTTVYKYFENGTYTGSTFSIAAQDSSAKGIAFDGTYLWVVGAGNDDIYKYTTGGSYAGTTIDTSLSFTENNPKGLTSNGTHLWLVGVNGQDVHRYTTGGTYQGSFTADAGTGKFPHGVAHDGTYLWVLYGNEQRIMKYNIAGTYQSVTDYIDHIDTFPRVMTTDDDDLWVIGEGNQNIFKLYLTLPDQYKIDSSSQTGGATFELEDGTDVTVTDQTGTKYVYVKDGSGNYIGYLEVDYDSASVDIDVEDLTVETNATSGKSLMHHDAFTGPVTGKLLVPVIGALGSATGYHCPSATTMAGVNVNCPGITSGYTTTVNVGGTDYIVMDNQGGGNGGPGVYADQNKTFNVTVNGTDPALGDMKCYDGNTGSFITVTPTAFSTTNIIC
ncbi:MAG: hypothetical protein GOV02_04340, partial [Candidatus Aenigmarchaeota archaeon]|nr:hypothetical protein [Candidatus Aenigmarchaeota archaeon]